jgi:hypothetical protein
MTANHMLLVRVHDYIYVGNQAAYERRKSDQLAIVQACKDPYHRMALGYSGRKAPTGHPEHLYAYRHDPERLILNLIDAEDPEYIKPQCIETAIDWIHEHVQQKTPVLIHCNQGLSRSPTIALLYLLRHTYRLRQPLSQAIIDFTKLYPAYLPANGMFTYLVNHWQKPPEP